MITRGYFLRLLAWAALVTALGTAAIAWSVRTVPHMGTPTPPAVMPLGMNDGSFPALTKLITRPLAWVQSGALFLAELAFLIVVARGWGGRVLGVYELIHDERGWVRFVNGLVYGLTIGNCLYVLYVLDPMLVPWPVGDAPTLFPVDPTSGRDGEAMPVRASGNFLLFTWLPVLAAVVVGRPWGVPWISLGMAASVLFSVVTVMVSWHVLTTTDVDWRVWFELTPGAAEDRIKPDGYVSHVIATGFTVLPAGLILLLLASAAVGRPGCPVWVVCLFLWLFNATYGFVGFHFAGLQFVMLLALIAVIVVANVGHPYKLSLPGLKPEYTAARRGDPRPIGVTVSPVLATRVKLITARQLLTGFHDRWRQSHPGGTKPKLVILCASGGGIRAGVWTAAVLDELHRQLGPAFGRHLRLITGASGGMVAAALHAGSHLFPLRPGLTPADSLFADSLWATWQGLFFRDLPGGLLPFHRDWDRGYTLERSWARNAPGPKGQRSPFTATFAELHAAELAGDAPSLVFSPFMVEDGRRLLVSNLCLSELAIESAPTLTLGADGTPDAGRQRISQPAVEFFRLFPEAHGRFQVSTAARLSASFPYVSPAVHLPTTPARRVVDAGFFDNYGVALAAGWLMRHQQLVRETCSGVAVIEVRAFPVEAEKTGLPERPARPAGLMSTILSGLSTPAEALGVLQSAGAYYRNDHLLGLLDVTLNTAQNPEFFVRLACECPGDGSLSWAISRPAFDTVLANVPPLRPGIAALKAWFGDGGG